MVIMAARGQRSRIYDAFSRDRSTPKADTYYGAENSLTAAIGEEVNGETTIIFRKKLEGKYLIIILQNLSMALGLLAHMSVLTSFRYKSSMSQW